MAENPGGTAAYPIRAVDRVCDLLDALRLSEGMSLTALAETVGLPKSSVLRYLSALQARGYVARDGASGSFTLGFAFRPDRSRYLEALADTARAFLVRMRDQFDETMNLAVLDGSEIVHVEVVESTRSVRLAARRGERAPIHSTAAGKAIATMLPDSALREILRHAGMPRFTPATIDDPDRFAMEIVRTAERGFGLDDCENQPDGRCVAVPLAGLAVPAAVSVSAPSVRLAATDVPAIAARLRKLCAPLDKALRAVPR